MYKGNGSNLECFEVSEQWNPRHPLANKAIHTQEETKVYAKHTLHVADANANAFATAFDLALPSCRYTRVEESTKLLKGSLVFLF
jgi:hypothetical protein